MCRTRLDPEKNYYNYLLLFGGGGVLFVCLFVSDRLVIYEDTPIPDANLRFPNHSAMARVLVYGGL